MMTTPTRSAACAWFSGFTIVIGGGAFAAHAADLTAPPPAAYGYVGVVPAVDPRCRIIPQPQANLYGDTARFRPTLVCLSRGLYADSVPFP